MDGLIEPSMPKLPSVIVKIKEDAHSQPTFGGADHTRASFDEEDQSLLGFIGEKKRFSFSPNATSSADGKKGSAPGSTENKLISSAMLTSRVQLSAKQKSDIAEAFEAFDVTGTGYMSTLDLRVALRALGFDAKKHEMKKLLSTFDKGNTGRLCYSDFMTIIEIKLGEPDTKEDIMKAFKLFDKDQVGRIAFHNLRQIANELGEDINDEEIAEMISEADLDDDGTLDQDEFYKILKRSSRY